MKAGGREVALGERFKLNQDEKVRVKDAALTIELKGVRRSWHVDGKSETADADLIITLDGKEQRQWVDIGEKLAAGGYVVELWGADPFGKTGCELIVTRR
jgi:dTDP-4-dehydrorhamnose 3,5-epimerase-like enzyme